MPKTRSQTAYARDGDTRVKMKRNTQAVPPFKAGAEVVTTKPRDSPTESVDTQLGETAPRPQPQSSNALTVDNPYFWSVNRVVDELCYKLPTRTPPSTRIPNLANLERIFRLYEVTGSVLLDDVVSHSILKERYKLKTLWERAYVRRAVEELWLPSPQFKLSRYYADLIRRYGLLQSTEDKRLDQPDIESDSSRDLDLGTVLGQDSGQGATHKRKRGISDDDGPAYHEHDPQRGLTHWHPFPSGRFLRLQALERLSLESESAKVLPSVAYVALSCRGGDAM
jgi:hypothetical protein